MKKVNMFMAGLFAFLTYLAFSTQIVQCEESVPVPKDITDIEPYVEYSEPEDAPD